MKNFSIVAGIILLLTLTSCASTLNCRAPNIIIEDSCCLDMDRNRVCDIDEAGEHDIIYSADQENSLPVVESVSGFPQESFDKTAELFADTWNRKSYSALRNMFSADTRMFYSRQEFNFLARRTDANLNISTVSLESIDGDSASFSVTMGDQIAIFNTRIIVEKDSLVHEPFFFFNDLSPENACVNDTSCFKEYAWISGNRNYCLSAGEFKEECKERFAASIGDRIAKCLPIVDADMRFDCLTTLAVNEDNIEPCWEAEGDRNIFGCMGKVAAARKSPEDCIPFVDSRGRGTREQVTHCIVSYVMKTEDVGACKLIDRGDSILLGAMQEGCYNLEVR